MRKDVAQNDFKIRLFEIGFLTNFAVLKLDFEQFSLFRKMNLKKIRCFEIQFLTIFAVLIFNFLTNFAFLKFNFQPNYISKWK